MGGIPHDHYEPKSGGEKWLHSRLPIDLARREVVAHSVDLIVSPPQFTGFRVKVVTDRISYTVGIHFAIRSIAIHTNNAANAGFVVKIHFLRWAAGRPAPSSRGRRHRRRPG